MKKIITGICPIYGKEAVINLSYLKVQTLKNAINGYILDTYQCNLKKFMECHEKSCPLIEQD